MPPARVRLLARGRLWHENRHFVRCEMLVRHRLCRGDLHRRPGVSVGESASGHAGEKPRQQGQRHDAVTARDGLKVTQLLVQKLSVVAVHFRVPKLSETPSLIRQYLE